LAVGRSVMPPINNEEVITDNFSPMGELEAGKIPTTLSKLMSLKLPTTTPIFSEKEREKVLSLIQPGDIIIDTDDLYPTWQFIEKLAFGSNYTHASFYEGNGNIIEATPESVLGKEGVVRTPLREYLTGRMHIKVIRPRYKTPEDRQAAINYVRSQLNKHYDSDLETKDDKALYCTELIYNALKSMPNPIYAKVTKVPLYGKDVVGPNAFEDLPEAQVVYDNGGSYWQSIWNRYPAYIAAAAASITAGLTMGATAAVGALFAGGLAALSIWNCYQNNQFSLFYKPNI